MFCGNVSPYQRVLLPQHNCRLKSESVQVIQCDDDNNNNNTSGRRKIDEAHVAPILQTLYDCNLRRYLRLQNVIKIWHFYYVNIIIRKTFVQFKSVLLTDFILKLHLLYRYHILAT